MSRNWEATPDFLSLQGRPRTLNRNGCRLPKAAANFVPKTKPMKVALMGTWLEFRSEPMSDVPEVEIDSFDGRVICEKCGELGQANNLPEADQMKAEHQKWHEDGMPE